MDVLDIIDRKQFVNCFSFSKEVVLSTDLALLASETVGISERIKKTSCDRRLFAFDKYMVI